MQASGEVMAPWKAGDHRGCTVCGLSSCVEACDPVKCILLCWYSPLPAFVVPWDGSGAPPPLMLWFVSGCLCVFRINTDSDSAAPWGLLYSSMSICSEVLSQVPPTLNCHCLVVPVRVGCRRLLRTLECLWQFSVLIISSSLNSSLQFGYTAFWWLFLCSLPIRGCFVK